jgi:hypothetical protein
MLKEIQNGLGRFFTREKVVLFLALIVLSWGIYTYSDSKNIVFDQMSNSTYVLPSTSMNMRTDDPIPSMLSTSTTMSSTPQNVGSSEKYALQPVTNPSDLLPQDNNSQWAALNPVSMNQGNVNMPDLLQAGYHIGLDTIGQTLRNANQQLRSDPVIPVQVVGPWNQSTIEPDLGRTPLEIGHCIK